MLSFILIACLMAFVTTAPIFAHQEADAPATGVEIGTLFGLSRLSGEGATATAIAVPAPPTLFSFAVGNPSLYVSWFPSENLAIGPEFSFGRFSMDEEDFNSNTTTLYLGGRAAFFLQSNAVSGLYLLGNGALLGTYQEDFSDHIFSAGAGLGYQWRVGPAFVVKAEGRYRRWFDGLNEFDEGLNDFSLFLGLGTRLGRR